jgi:hypothetical protein
VAKRRAKKAEGTTVVYEFLAPVRIHAKVSDGVVTPDYALVNLADISEYSFVISSSPEEGERDSSQEKAEVSSLLFGDGNTPPIYWEGYPTNPEFNKR